MAWRPLLDGDRVRVKQGKFQYLPVNVSYGTVTTPHAASSSEFSCCTTVGGRADGGTVRWSTFRRSKIWQRP